MNIRQNYTVHFLVLCKELVLYFVSIRRGVIIIFDYENILQPVNVMTTHFLSKLRRK